MTDEHGYTIKELVLQVLQDVRTLDAKVDGFISAHQQQHAAESLAAATAMADPEATSAGRRVVSQISDHERRLGALEREAEADRVVNDDRARTQSRDALSFRWRVGIASAVGGAIVSGVGQLYSIAHGLRLL